MGNQEGYSTHECVISIQVALFFGWDIYFKTNIQHRKIFQSRVNYQKRSIKKTRKSRFCSAFFSQPKKNQQQKKTNQSKTCGLFAGVEAERRNRPRCMFLEGHCEGGSCCHQAGTPTCSCGSLEGGKEVVVTGGYDMNKISKTTTLTNYKH